MILFLHLLLLDFLVPEFALGRLERLLRLLQFLNGRLLLGRQFRRARASYGPLISFLLRFSDYRVLIQSGLRFGCGLWLRNGGLLLVPGILPGVLPGLLLILSLLSIRLLLILPLLPIELLLILPLLSVILLLITLGRLLLLIIALLRRLLSDTLIRFQPSLLFGGPLSLRRRSDWGLISLLLHRSSLITLSALNRLIF